MSQCRSELYESYFLATFRANTDTISTLLPVTTIRARALASAYRACASQPYVRLSLPREVFERPPVCKMHSTSKVPTYGLFNQCILLQDLSITRRRDWILSHHTQLVVCFRERCVSVARSDNLRPTYIYAHAMDLPRVQLSLHKALKSFKPVGKEIG